LSLICRSGRRRRMRSRRRRRMKGGAVGREDKEETGND
jgi:hypothetical protein